MSLGPRRLACPDCPLCGRPPALRLVGDIQAFCGNPDCDVICWNPSVGLDENLANAGRVSTAEGKP